MAFRVLFVLGLLVSVANSFAQPAQVLKFLSRHTQLPASFDVGSAEVVAYDPGTKTVIVSDLASNRISYVSIANPAVPVLVRNVMLNAYNGVVNGVAVKNGLVAVALEAIPKTDPGKVLFFDMSGVFKSLVTVGSLPDMVVFTPDGAKLIVCNEGEPNADYNVDPEGSVSIVTVTNPALPTVQTVSFTALNASKDSLKHMGIRIYGPNASVAQDFEPEYASVSADGKTAYVTLQESNAIAIVDIATATLTRVVALGYKDYSKGKPRSTNYTWTNRPVLGTTPAGQAIHLGGFSGLWFEGYGANSNKLIFLTHPDRGPNAEPTTLRGQLRRPFAMPNFQCEVVRFELDKTTGAFTVLNRIPLFRKNGTTPISGKPNLQAAGQGIAYTDEFGVDLYGNDLANDTMGADLEGISVAQNGTWWLVDEYRPAIYNFNSTGVLIDRFVAAGTAASVGAPANAYGVEALPAVYAARRANRGFEACAIEGDVLYAFIQSPLDNPDLANDNSSKGSSFCRILAFNTTSKQVVGEYLYPMHEKYGSADKIGDATALGNGKFLVVERDDATGLKARKYIFEIDLKGATNIFNLSVSIPAGRSIETLTFAELATRGIKPVHKRKSVYLPGAGYGSVDKVEGLTRIDATTWAVINDNDFGVGGSTLPNPPNGSITVNPNAHPVLGIITFDGPNGLDGCDRDNAINIRNWPVYGMYEPDAIAAVTIGTDTYLVTANEGDARDYTTFTEEARLSAMALDPVRFAAWPNLKTNAEIGRLNVTNTLGDLDGDGLFDELYTLGGRSFSIWNTDGNLIFDSGSDFETKTSALFPANFNTGHTTNSLEDRSDNKGPEPEAISIGVINDSVYAFIGCERIGHTFMYNISNVTSPKYIDYINSRNFAVTPNLANVANGTVGDLGVEVLHFIQASESPNSGDMIIAGNEISGTLSVYQVRIPRIVSVPVAAIAMCIGDRMTLVVQATGANLTFQWSWNNVDIPLATSATYAVDITSQTQAGSYACRVTSDGGMTIPTRPTVVTVFERTKITLEPKALTQVDEQVTVNLSITATEKSGETYQWYKAGSPLADNSKYRGTRTRYLSILFVGFADTSAAYYCIVTGGCSVVRSKNAAVYIPRILFTQQPSSVRVCPGDSVQFSAAAKPSGGDKALTYRWKIPYGAFLKDGGRISGAGSPNLRINGITEEDQHEYVCVVMGFPSGEVLHSSVANAIVEQDPIITAQPVGDAGSNRAQLCDDGNVYLSVFAEGQDVEYQWYRNGNAIPLATNHAHRAFQGGVYSVRITGVCEDRFVQSDIVTIDHRTTPVLGLQPAQYTRVKKGTNFSITFTIKSGSDPITYQWYRNDATIVGATSITFSKTDASLDDEGAYYCIATNTCGRVVTQNSNIDVWEEEPTSVNDDALTGNDALTRDDALTLKVEKAGMVNIEVLDLQGRVVYRLSNIMYDAGVHRIDLNKSDVGAAGAFFLRIEQGGSVSTRAILIVD